MPPALKIPVNLDLASLEQQGQRASESMNRVLRGVGQAYSRVNGEMVGIAASSAGASALAWSQSAARTALSFAGMATLAYAGFKIVGGLISEAQAQIAEMVRIAEKAQNLRLSPETFQAFTKSAGTAKDSVASLEEAIGHFQDRNKSVLNPDAAVGDTDQHKRKWTELETIIGGLKIDLLENAIAADKFLHALTDDEKVRATLGIIQQLVDQGQKLEALDLADKAFGGKFADNLRNGKTEIDKIIANFDRLKASAGDAIFTDNTVQRAKEVNDKLEEAHRELRDNMHPAIETVSRALLGVKDLWGDIVKLIAEAAALIPKVPQEIPLSGPIGDRVEEQIAALRSKLAGDYVRRGAMLGGQSDDLMGGDLGALDKLNAEITKTEARLAQLEQHLVSVNSGGAGNYPLDQFGNPLLPRMRPKSAPGPEDKDTDEGKRDRFDASADSIEKRTAALVAETEHINENTAARERAKVTAELEAVAKQINSEAGRGDNVILDEQRKRIDEVAEAFGRARQAAADAHAPLQTFVRESANLNMAFNKFAEGALSNTTDALADFVIGAKTGQQAMHDLILSIERDLARLLIRKYITGPIGNLFTDFLPSPNGGGGGGNNSDVRTRGGGSERAAVRAGLDFAPASISVSPQLAGPHVVNNFTLPPNSHVEKRQRQQGGTQINDFIVSTVNEAITSHKMQPAMGSTYGAQPRLARRG